jgi:hypothetical protein
VAVPCAASRSERLSTRSRRKPWDFLLSVVAQCREENPIPVRVPTLEASPYHSPVASASAWPRRPAQWQLHCKGSCRPWPEDETRSVVAASRPPTRCARSFPMRSARSRCSASKVIASSDVVPTRGWSTTMPTQRHASEHGPRGGSTARKGREQENSSSRGPHPAARRLASARCPRCADRRASRSCVGTGSAVKPLLA